ncbi:MAG: hypothetical protein IIA88_06190 [Bacteroidetes bacterium]|nr:hypothetical protein [Bacteroidota bacterium]
MKSKFLIIGFLLCSLLSYSQTGKLKYLEGNLYLTKTVRLNIDSIETYLEENYNELEKDEQGLVRTIVLNFKNDTLTIIDYDLKGIKYRLYFNSGKRGMVMIRNDIWIY